MFDDILVPTDGSACARAAVEHAEDLARHCDASIHALCVADSRALETVTGYEQLETARRDLAERTCKELAERGLSAEHAVRTDVPHRAILRYAADQDVDLVVMGSHGRTGPERFLLGSVTEKVVRRSDVPVLTVKLPGEGGHSFPYRDVLVPTDGSDGAVAAVEPALALAAAYEATMHTLSVVDVKTLGPDVRPALDLEALEASARSAVEAIETRARQAGISEVTTAVRVGYPYSAIRSYVEERDVDVVVMGTHGRSGISRYLLGSVTEKLIRTCPVPVMTVRRPDPAGR